jgi:hypothetical protein
MNFRLKGHGLPLGGSDFLGGCFLLGNGHPVRIDIIHGFHFTETNALGISVAEIALKILPVDDIEPHCAEGANRHAGTATDTDIVVHHHPAQILIAGDGLHGANDQTGGVLALLAGHGNVKPLGFPFYDLDPASRGIGHAVMKDRADKLTEPAAGALFGTDGKNFTHGFH